MTDVTVAPAARSYVEWAPIFAGAITAAAVSVLLLAFGSAIGLTGVSPWPDSGMPWWFLALIAAFWFLLVQIGSYAAGGYLAGRLRAPLADATQSEVQFRDGAHGFLVWALGIAITALILGSTVGAALNTATQSAATVASGAAAAAGRAATDSDAADPLRYAVERLFRSPTATTDLTEQQIGEATGILASGVAAEELPADDRTYLISTVSARAGITPDEATQRVDQAFAAASELSEDARETADAARRAAIVAGFLATTALLLSAAAAALAGGLGGRHRDEGGSVRIFGSERLW